MRRYGGGILYATSPLHMKRGCFWIQTHNQQVTKAQLYRCARACPQVTKDKLSSSFRGPTFLDTGTWETNF